MQHNDSPMNAFTMLRGLTPHYTAARRRYLQLSDEQIIEIERGFHRHVKACRKTDIAPDPQWVVEALGDITKD